MNINLMNKRIGGKPSPFYVFLLVACLLLSPAWVAAQKKYSITLNVQNEAAESVFHKITQQTGLKFFYDYDVVKNVPLVTLNVTDAALKTVLGKVTDQTKLKFDQKKETILVSAGKAVKAQRGKPVTAKGRVLDANGEPVIGATVQVPGTTTGTITDIDGNFAINAETGQELLVSYVGFQSAKVKVSERPLNVELVESSIAVDEVVVTALGIKKEKKALAYSVTEVKGDDMNRVKVANLATGLAGKVAGVNVSKPATGVMGSSRIIIRGNGSLAGDNQPLYVIDGVPMDNSNYGQAGLWGGADGGDGISSINSEDIESMSVLKGGTAAALYGSRAANGAIVITTKRGSVGKVRLEYNMSYTNEHLTFKNDDFQWEYGSGIKGVNPEMMAYGIIMNNPNIPEAYRPTYIESTAKQLANQLGTMSFGGKLDGSMVMQFDGVRRPYVASGKDNFKNFYENGWSLTNNVAVSGGTDKVQFRLAVGDQRFHDLMPNSKLGRNNITLSVNSKLDEHLTIKANVMYVRERTHNRPFLGDMNFNASASLYSIAPNTNVLDLQKAVNEDGTEFLPSGNGYIHNPYYIANYYNTQDSKDRVIGSVEAQYNFTPNWYLRGRVGGDMINRRAKDVIPWGTATLKEGQISTSSTYNGEFNVEAIAGYTNTFKEGKFSVDAFVGWNTMGSWWNSTSAFGKNFIQPGFNAMGNAGVTSGSHTDSESYINSIFGQAEFSYNRMLYLTFTGRNDWFSALSYKGKSAKNNIFYPSVGAGFIVSEAVKLPEWIPFLKVRGSWSQSGGGVGPYQLGLTYAYNQSFGKYPIGSIGGDGVIPNMNLKPLTSISYEAGIEARFLNNRLGLDLTYYVRNTKDDIVDAGVSSASGYGAVKINAGKVHNHGIELLLTAVPVKTRNFTWNSSFNFSYNKSEVKHITEGIKEFQIQEARTNHQGGMAFATIMHEVGEPYGIIKGTPYKRNDKGEIMFQNGVPMRGELTKLGETVSPYTFGLNNSFSYKGINVSFLIDAKVGGKLFSQTNDFMYFFGRHKNTLPGREGGVIGKGVKEDGVTPNDVKVDAMTYYMAQAGITEEFIYDASFVKLRELSVGYTFPQKWVKKLGMSSLSLALVGRNLWNIYDDVPLVDPESCMGIGNGQGFELYGLPATRSIGFNLNVKF